MSLIAYHIPLDAVVVEKTAGELSSPPSWEDELIAVLHECKTQSSSPPPQQAMLDFARRVKAKNERNIDECLLVLGPQWAELYLVEDAAERRPAPASPLVQLYPSLALASNQDAAARFLRSALGWLPNNERDTGHREAFRSAYGLAAEHGLTGVTLNRLFQRALWLFEKVRIETEFFHHPTAVDGVLIEVAGKIFGGLQERAALVIGSGEELPLATKALQQAGLNRVYFYPEAPTKPELKNSAQVLGSMAQLPPVDLLLLFDHTEPNFLTRAHLQKLMAARNNAPLLLVDFTAEAAAPTTKSSAGEGIEKIYNLFRFRRRDLQKLVEQNLQARQPVESEVAGWIRDEVKQFFQWLDSEDRFHFGLMVGRSREMQRVFELIARIAQTDITVLIEGESGTGKELVARAIHQSSARARRPFVAVNCGALPENLLESELFGHVRGAFTGAVSNKRGLIEDVNGGTIFLDEIGEMSPALQVKLLRFLQDGEIKPVGSNTVAKLDVRVLAATNRRLQAMVQDGKFRSDLYYRLNVIGINLPPLRERPEDVEILARHFMRKFASRMRKPIATLSQEALQQLRRYSWPGNVRELENVMERAIALTGNTTLDVIDLPAHVREAASPQPALARLPLKEIERQYILETVSACNDNYDEAARVLGIGRTTLWRKLKEYLNENGTLNAAENA